MADGGIRVALQRILIRATNRAGGYRERGNNVEETQSEKLLNS